VKNFNYVFAYTNSNLGDDLFLYVLCNRYPNERFLIESEQKNQLERLGLKNLIIVNKNRFISFISKVETKLFSTSFIKKLYLKKYGTVKSYIQIGGSLFMEENNWEIKLERHKKFLNKNLPYYLIGCNFGPYKTNKYYNKYKEVFLNYTDVCFRDKNSYDLFSENLNSRCADDVVFNLEKDVNYDKKNMITISPIELIGRKDLEEHRENYINKIIEIIEYYSKRSYEICMLSFCPPEGDSRIIQVIKNKTKVDIKVVEYNSNVSEIIKIIASSKLVVATRFHAMILSIISGVPVLPLIYSDKMTNVLNDIGSYSYRIQIQSIDNLDIKEVLKIEEIPIKKHNAYEQFKELDKFLLYS